jgi:hypothetical protein
MMPEDRRPTTTCHASSTNPKLCTENGLEEFLQNCIFAGEPALCQR